MSSAGGTIDVESTVTQDVDAIKDPGRATGNDVIQSAPSPSNQVKVSAQHDAVGHDSSHLLTHPEPSSMDSTAAAQQISENREPSYTREEATTTQIRQAPEHSTIASLKHEHSSRTQSPLRESSVPVPSTEMNASVAPSAPPKRNHKKKGVAAAAAVTKRNTAAPAKRSHKKKVVASSTATPAQSSPAPRSVLASSPARSSPDVDGNGDQNMSEDEGEEEEEGGAISDTDLYCICRKPDTGTFMIGCDGCDDWFHGKCVNISEKWKTLIDKYICPFCEERGVGETTWKRMCRRNGCGMPAQVANNSKFCSERCGQLFFQGLIAERTRQLTDGDLGARGGLITGNEVKSMIQVCPTVEAFHKFNNGSISPVPGSSPGAMKDEGSEDEAPLSHESALNDIERERIDQITNLRATARARHSLLRDKLKFVKMLKTVASRLADHRAVKPKDLCGYDSRISWSEEEFDVWRSSEAGQEALRIESLPLPSDEDLDGDTGMTGFNDSEPSTCMKKKCGRHYDWAKLAMDDTKDETSQNNQFMHGLDKEEKEIIERARLRAREIKAGGVGGTVEFHGLSAPKENKEDREMGVGPVVEERHVQPPAQDVEMEEEKTVGILDAEETPQQQDGPNDDEDKEVDMVDAITTSI
ncbi:hypothetical protein KCU65_g7137, partial [Aureobasidium melanogenum]